MAVESKHVRRAFDIIRDEGISPNKPSTKWDIIDPDTGERFPPKAVLRVAKSLAGDNSALQGGGWPTNDPLQELGFQIALKPHLEPISPVAADIEQIIDSDVDETTKQRLVNARLGQGGFREALIEIWDGQCAMTACDIEPVLRASHIKPWAVSTDAERLDPRNGLLLAASIDALFDRCLITIDEVGAVLAAASLQDDSLERLGLSRGHHVDLSAMTQKYMGWHRSEFARVSEGRGRKY
jgi:hypothetical protein